jgi:hypothetical protein
VSPRGSGTQDADDGEDVEEDEDLEDLDDLQDPKDSEHWDDLEHWNDLEHCDDLEHWDDPDDLDHAEGSSKRVTCAVLMRRRRENEAAFLEKLNEGIAKGTAWERITELISLENSREWRCFARLKAFFLLKAETRVRVVPR